MIGYVTLGTNDIQRSAAFYDKLLAEIGAKRIMEPAQVDKVYKKALELGAKDEGAAGPRGSAFYAGYFRDPDGNKLNVFCTT